MRPQSRQWQITNPGKFRINQAPTRWPEKGAASASGYESALEDFRERMSRFQQALYIERRRSVLIILQGMDTSGKDGVIKHLLTGVNPQGVAITSFKAPSELERSHDFLWRIHARLPEGGQIGVFNRSHYEDFLFPWVHPESAGLSGGRKGAEDRLEDIVAFEAYLQRQGVEILKFFLHLSKGEQKRRLLDRVDRPEKNWKLSWSDAQERKHWDRYQQAYELCLSRTSTRMAPWYVIPADDKKGARLLIAHCLLDRLKGMRIVLPEPDQARKRELQAIRRSLLSNS